MNLKRNNPGIVKTPLTLNQGRQLKWTKRLSQIERDLIAKEVRHQRLLQLSNPTKEYSASRRAITYKGGEQDVIATIQKKLAIKKRKGPLRILDSGAGILGVAADIKKTFGQSVSVTGLTLKHPNTSVESERIALDRTKVGSQQEALKIRGQLTFAQLVGHHRRVLQRGRENSKIVDRVKVGLLENLKGKEKYDIIFDLHGAILYSQKHGRVIALYKKMLPKGGILVTTKNVYEGNMHGFKITHEHGFQVFEKL